MKQLLRRPEVEARYGRGRSSIYSDISGGLFVPPVLAGKRCSAWPSDEVDAIIAARIAGKTEDEIRALVRKLVAARRMAA